MTLADIAAALSAGRAASLGLDLALGRVRVTVRSDSPELLTALAEAFREFVIPSGREAGEPDIAVTALEAPPAPEGLGLGLDLAPYAPEGDQASAKEEWIDLPDGRATRKRRTGMALLFGPRVSLAVGPCRRRLDQVVNFVNFRVMARHLSRRALLAHAAGAVRDGRGLLLAGRAGAGKSTLALWLLSRGWSFCSNDRLLILEPSAPPAPAVRMAGMAKAPRINPGTALSVPGLDDILPPDDRERYRAMDARALRAVEHKFDARIETLYGPGRFVLDAPLSAMVILTCQPGGGPTRLAPVRLAERPDLLAAMRKRPGLYLSAPETGPYAGAEETAWLSRLDGLPAWELSGEPDFAAASRALTERFAAPAR